MSLEIELSAVVVTVKDNDACVLCLSLAPGPGPAYALPSGPFLPHNHRTFDLALRAFVQDQTGFNIGYVEQLYSFGDDGRQALLADLSTGIRAISVGYLALTPSSDFTARIKAAWVPFERFFPWEDWRAPGGNVALDKLRPALDAWCHRMAGDEFTLRQRRVETLFPHDFSHWNEERVLDRYELLYDAGLVAEAIDATDTPASSSGALKHSEAGAPMASDHRRIVATGLSRLRGKLKYRPIIFELMPEMFTLLDLQRSLEAISGIRLHKQNFRRSLELSLIHI